jgi:hypothetical protein
MKKVFIFSLLLVALFITGCGNDEKENENGGNPLNGGTNVVSNEQRLVCSQKVQTVDVNMIADFRGNELTYLGLKYEMDLRGYNDAQIKAIEATDMCTTVKNSMQAYTNSSTNCKQSVINKVLVITADFDLDKLIAGDIKREAKIEDVKAGLEKQNYKCTIN